ncbi:MAG: response regulator [Isosphaeraceae bacterium]
MPSTSRRSGASAKILIAEDVRDFAEMLAFLLKRKGHEVHLAFDGPGAVDVARKERPDCILLDIGLPRMCGYDVARLIRSEAAGWPVQPMIIAVSGYGREEDRRLSYEAGSDHHLLKPIEMDSLDALLAARCAEMPPSQGIDHAAAGLDMPDARAHDPVVDPGTAPFAPHHQVGPVGRESR